MSKPQRRCPICWGPLIDESMMYTYCGHMFHQSCLKGRFKADLITCPLCDDTPELSRNTGESDGPKRQPLFSASLGFKTSKAGASKELNEFSKKDLKEDSKKDYGKNRNFKLFDQFLRKVNLNDNAKKSKEDTDNSNEHHSKSNHHFIFSKNTQSDNGNSKITTKSESNLIKTISTKIKATESNIDQPTLAVSNKCSKSKSAGSCTAVSKAGADSKGSSRLVQSQSTGTTKLTRVLSTTTDKIANQILTPSEIPEGITVSKYKYDNNIKVRSKTAAVKISRAQSLESGSKKIQNVNLRKQKKEKCEGKKVEPPPSILVEHLKHQTTLKEREVLPEDTSRVPFSFYRVTNAQRSPPPDPKPPDSATLKKSDPLDQLTNRKLLYRSNTIPHSSINVPESPSDEPSSSKKRRHHKNVLQSSSSINLSKTAQNSKSGGSVEKKSLEFDLSQSLMALSTGTCHARPDSSLKTKNLEVETMNETTLKHEDSATFMQEWKTQGKLNLSNHSRNSEKNGHGSSVNIWKQNDTLDSISKPSRQENKKMSSKFRILKRFWSTVSLKSNAHPELLVSQSNACFEPSPFSKVDSNMNEKQKVMPRSLVSQSDALFKHIHYLQVIDDDKETDPLSYFFQDDALLKHALNSKVDVAIDKEKVEGKRTIGLHPSKTAIFSQSKTETISETAANNTDSMQREKDSKEMNLSNSHQNSEHKHTIIPSVIFEKEGEEIEEATVIKLEQYTRFDDRRHEGNNVDNECRSLERLWFTGPIEPPSSPVSQSDVCDGSTPVFQLDFSKDEKNRVDNLEKSRWNFIFQNNAFPIDHQNLEWCEKEKSNLLHCPENKFKFNQSGHLNLTKFNCLEKDVDLYAKEPACSSCPASICLKKLPRESGHALPNFDDCNQRAASGSKRSDLRHRVEFNRSRSLPSGDNCGEKGYSNNQCDHFINSLEKKYCSLETQKRPLPDLPIKEVRKKKKGTKPLFMCLSSNAIYCNCFQDIDGNNEAGHPEGIIDLPKHYYGYDSCGYINNIQGANVDTGIKDNDILINKKILNARQNVRNNHEATDPRLEFHLSSRLKPDSLYSELSNSSSSFAACNVNVHSDKIIDNNDTSTNCNAKFKDSERRNSENIENNNIIKQNTTIIDKNEGSSQIQLNTMKALLMNIDSHKVLGYGERKDNDIAEEYSREVRQNDNVQDILIEEEDENVYVINGTNREWTDEVKDKNIEQQEETENGNVHSFVLPSYNLKDKGEHANIIDIDDVSDDNVEMDIEKDRNDKRENREKEAGRDKTMLKSSYETKTISCVVLAIEENDGNIIHDHDIYEPDRYVIDKEELTNNKGNETILNLKKIETYKHDEIDYNFLGENNEYIDNDGEDIREGRQNEEVKDGFSEYEDENIYVINGTSCEWKEVAKINNIKQQEGTKNGSENGSDLSRFNPKYKREHPNVIDIDQESDDTVEIDIEKDKNDKRENRQKKAGLHKIILENSDEAKEDTCIVLEIGENDGTIIHDHHHEHETDVFIKKEVLTKTKENEIILDLIENENDKHDESCYCFSEDEEDSLYVINGVCKMWSPRIFENPYADIEID